MLILSRRVGESIYIGDEIRVVLTSVHNGQIRVGILAPHDIAVHREEIYNRIQLKKTDSVDAVEKDK